MEPIRIGLLLLYVLIRAIPFALTTFYLFSEKKRTKTKTSPFSIVNKVILFCVGIGLNAGAFLGMHYYYYRDFVIIGYIKNIWGLNFYYHDVEYFLFSAAVAIVFSIVTGVLLAMFLDERPFAGLVKGWQYMVAISGMVFLALIIMGMQVRNYYNSNIRINEICSDNESYILDGDTLIEDYVELYNSGKIPCKISGLYLSDDKHDLHKISLDGEIIAAEGNLVVPCREGVHSFAIDNEGEVLYLSDSNGNILEQIEVIAMEGDSSYARIDGDNWEVRSCSPGNNNDVIVEEYQVPQPVLSHASGFYDNDFELEITCAEDVAVYYTVDGRMPDEGSYLYEGPIHVYDKSAEPNVWRSVQNVVPEWKEYEPDMEPVDKAFLIRAVAVDSEGRKSDETVATYFIDKEQYKGATVISLITDPDNLYNDETGMYVTGKWYDEWYLNGQEGNEPSPNFKIGFEKPAIFELFEESESVLQQNVGIRLQGASSREHEDKRFSVYAREEYSGSDLLDMKLFDRETKSHSLLIRDNFADLLCQNLMQGRDIPLQRGKPVYLFLDGEQWFKNRTMREKYSAQYFEDYYGVVKDNLMLFKSGSVDKGVESDQRFYDSLCEYVVGNNFADEDVYRRFCEMVDVSNYIDYMCANIYCSNMDVDDTKNVVMWRSREVTDDEFSDGRWRWALFDMDALEWTSLNYYQVEEVAAVDSFSQKPRYAGCPYNQTMIYSALRKNEEFCKQFVLTFMDLMNTNFTPENASRLLEKYGKDITWMDSFFEKRPEYMKKYLAKEFELTGTVEEVVICNETEEYGTVSINSAIPEMTDGRWVGEYFTDYPVTVVATPAKGYEFIGWSGSVASDEQILEIPVEQGGITLKAEFQKIK